MESKKFTTLLVDDATEDVSLFQECLQEGTLYHVSEKEKVLPFVLEHSPDIVFLNTHLSRTTTLDCLQVLKNNPQSSNIPIVIYSTPSSSEEVRKCMSLGAMRYLIKPINARGLLFGLQIIMYLARTGSILCNDPEEFLINTNHGYFVY